MAANINYNEKSKEYSFYSKKEVPWHGLGQFVTEAETAEEALRLAHLDYQVIAGDVFANFIPKGCTAVSKEDGGFNFLDKNKNIVGTSTKKGVRIPKYKCLYRDDTKEVFDIVSDRYEVVQNFEALDVIYDIVRGPEVTDKNQIVIQTAGALGSGETIFVTAKMPSYIINIGGAKDPVDKYIVFTTSHNKSAQVTALITDIRVVCNNTLNMALKSPRKVSFRHTKNVREKFTTFSQLLGVANKYSQDARKVLEHLATVQVTPEIVRNYVFDNFVPADKIPYINDKNGKIETVSTEFISTRVKNKVNEALLFIENGAGQDVARGSAYWLYNGVTSYIHNGMSYKDGEDRFDSILNGSSEKLVTAAFDNIRKYVRI